MVPFFKNIAERKKLFYGAALLLVIVPSIALGLFGSWGISTLEDQPAEFHAEARRHVEYLNSRLRDYVLSSLPEDALPWVRRSRPPTPSDPAAAKAEQATASSSPQPATEAPALVSREEAYAAQQRYLGQTAAPLALAAVNFIGHRHDRTIFGPRRPPSVEQTEWLERMQQAWDELRAMGREAGFRTEMLRGSAKNFEQVLYLEAGGNEPVASDAPSMHPDQALPETGDGFVQEEQCWTIWVLDANRLRDVLLETARGITSTVPLTFEVLHATDRTLNDERVRLALPLDQQMLPMWTLAARLDESRLPAGEEWRSRFFLVFFVLLIPMLGAVIWFIGSAVFRAVEEARKKVDFVANVTHELKTPLTSIRMFTEMMLMGRIRSEEERREMLDIMLKESERLGRLIDRILDFNKLERQAKVFTFRPENVGELVKETVSIFRTQIRGGNEHQIKLAIQPGIPRVTVDRDGIREVVLNLLSNALKYSENKPVNVRLYHDGRWLLLDVIDQGRGIPAEHHQKIFEKFYRVNDELNREVEGSGLGLPICLAIIQAHGGTIAVSSTPGKGSRFTVKLPLKNAIDSELIEGA